MRISCRCLLPSAGALLGLLLTVLPAGWAGAGDNSATGMETHSTLAYEEASPERGVVGVAPTSEPVRLEDSVVTALRADRQVFDVPYEVDVIDEEDIRSRRLSRVVTDVFKQDPSIMVQTTAQGMGSPYIRGFTGYQTLFLVDGIRLNNSVFRSGPNEYWNLVDPYTIWRLEIVKGPSSVLYGSDAVGGTVNVITRGREPSGEGLQGEGGLMYRYSSADNGHAGRAEGSGGWEETGGVIGGFSFKDTDDLAAGRDVGLQPKTGYDQFCGDVKATHPFSRDSELVLAYQHVAQEDLWRTHKTEYGISWEGTNVGNEKEHFFDYSRQLAYAQFLAEDMGSMIDSAKLSLSYQRLEEERYRVRNNDRSDRQGFDVGTLGFWGQIGSVSPVGTWTCGVEYYRDFVDSFRKDFSADGGLTKESIQGPVADDANYDLLGVFCQDEIPIGGRLSLAAGVRYNYASADADKVEDPETGRRISVRDSWNNLVGSLRAVYGLWDGLNLYGGVSQGFRAPNLSDLTRFDGARSDEIETPSPGLDPEKYLACEIGAKAHRGKGRGEVAYFYTFIDDMIDRYVTGKVIDEQVEVRKANVGDGFVQGVDMRLFYSLTDAWMLRGAFSWTQGEVDTFPTSAAVIERRPMSKMPPLSGTFGVNWEHISGNYWAEGFVLVAGGQDRLSPRDEEDTQRIPPGGTPGYAILTLRGGLRLMKGLRLNGAVENVTNEDYRIHGSGVNGAGTNFIASIDWRF